MFRWLVLMVVSVMLLHFTGMVAVSSPFLEPKSVAMSVP